MAWQIFPDDAKQALRLRRFFMAALSYVIWIGLTFYCYRLGLVEVSPGSFALAVALTFICNIAFFVILRSGLNQYWPDPSLTLPQMLVATFWVMLLMALAPKVRGTLLLLYVVVFLFGVFRLNRRQYLGLTAVVLVSYGLVILRDMYLSRSVEPLPLALMHYVVLAATLIWVAFFGSYVGKLRETVARRNSELASALARNRELAVHDDLTGTYNRRHIIHLLEQEQFRAQRSSRGFCVCLMDLDHFKEVNDKHGHLGGDEVLRQFAQRVMGEIRLLDRLGRDGHDPGSNFARYGGEEFLLVLPETELAGAQVCAERIRLKVSDTVFNTASGPLHITMSCGIADHRPGEDIRATLSRADQALYLAKEQGRDRIEIARA